MNKGELIKAIAAEAGLTQREAGLAFEALVKTVTKQLKTGKKVTVPGFGTYELKKRAARMGINPATKAKIKIAASKVPTFKFSKSFKGQF
jgi:DNA-binding protein HU-beta